MVNAYFLAPAEEDTPRVKLIQDEPAILTLESLDGSRQLILDGYSGWTHLPGSTGLEMPPIDVITSQVPGVYGSVLEDVRVDERSIFIPMDACSPDYAQVTHRAMMNEIRSLVDPLLGEFRVVCGDRQLTVIYNDGLQGSFGTNEFGLYWRKFGLKATACQPFAEARTGRSVEFAMSAGDAPFLDTAGGTNSPWGTRAISSSAVVGDGMRVLISSEVPVYPTVDLVGPMDSFTGDMDLEDPRRRNGGKWQVSVPTGVPEGQMLRIVTDPRARSIRLGPVPAEDEPFVGELAAGRVARGSALRPFYPGTNVMNVAAPGGGEDTRIRIWWRDLYRSLW